GGEGGEALRAGTAQDVEQAEHRAQRVSVGADVAREGDVGGVADRIDGAVECPFHLRRARLRHCSSCRWSSRMMSSTRCPAVIAGSSRNDSRGRYLSRTWTPYTPPNCEPAGCSAFDVASRCSAPPFTLYLTACC